MRILPRGTVADDVPEALTAVGVRRCDIQKIVFMPCRGKTREMFFAVQGLILGSIENERSKN